MFNMFLCLDRINYKVDAPISCKVALVQAPGNPQVAHVFRAVS